MENITARFNVTSDGVNGSIVFEKTDGYFRKMPELLEIYYLWVKEDWEALLNDLNQ